MPTKTSGDKISLVDKETNMHIKDSETANYINNFFANIGTTLAQHFDTPWVDDVSTNSGIIIDDLVVNEDLLLKIIQNIDTHKSSSITNVSSRILKDAFLVTIPQLTYMYNLSLRTCTFPDSWKLANVIPLQKPGDRSDVGNLRLISLLPLPGKILERIVHSQVSTFLENNNLLSERQGGFRKGKSTIATVSAFTDDLLLGIKDKEYTLATYIDFKKAFDTVNHQILLKKLPHYGLSPHVVNWFSSYLSKRFQCCTVNGKTSTNLPITCGVPQGSILGPMLFLLYINDIQDALSNQNVYLYADDTVIFSTDTDLRIAHHNVQHELSSLLHWCNQNKLTINTKKTKVMVFGTNNMLKRAHPPPIRLGNDELMYVPNYSYLGVKLDSKLNFESHALECVRQVSHKIYTLTKIRPLINNTQALCLYKSKILPYFDYGDIFCIRTFARSLSKLQKLQNRALKLCLCKDHLYNTDLLHLEANVPKLDARRICHITNFAFA